MTTDSRPPVVVGSGAFTYEVVPDWPQLPDGWSFYEAVSVAVDSRDRVFVFNRGEHPVIVFDRDGKFLSAWGEGCFVRPHGIWIGPDDMLYLSDDSNHTVQKYTPDGELVFTLGTAGRASDTGCTDMDYRAITHPGPPFNYPTNLVLSTDGEMFVSDGYGNCRVHKFSADGKHLLSWGEPGDGPGQFHLPHGIGIDSTGRIFVADRENSRLQLFSSEGAFLDQWTDVVRPTQVFFDADDHAYVAELGRRAGLFSWMTTDPEATGGRVSIFDRDGRLICRIGGGDHPCAPGDFYTPHDVSIDSEGSLYVAEVTMSGGGRKGLIPADCPSLQKFVRRGLRISR